MLVLISFIVSEGIDGSTNDIGHPYLSDFVLLFAYAHVVQRMFCSFLFSTFFFSNLLLLWLGWNVNIT